MRISKRPFIKTASLLFCVVSIAGFQACKEENSVESPLNSSARTSAALDLPDQTFYALTDKNQIYELNVQNTTSPVRTLTLTGLEPDEKILGIDFRPATGQLYAVGNKNHIYHINLRADIKPGLATLISAVPFNPGISAPEAIGFDFNPTVDRIRLVSNTAQNLRLHPETGELAAKDGDLNGYPVIHVAAAAYTNNYAGATTTRLFDIDPTTDKLYLQNPPNNGVLVEAGSLGIDISDVGGFDISSSSDFAIASVLYNGKWELDQVNLSTGALQKLGDLPAGKIIGIAIPTSPVAYAVDASNKLIIFNPVTNQTNRIEKAITGLPSGVTIEGIDFRPVNGRLHALGSNGSLYSIDLGSGASRMLSDLKNVDDPTFSVKGVSFGVDFNPMADRLRVVTNTGQNLRINVANGVTIVDGPLNLIPGPGTPFVTGAAYTNSFAGTTSTILYDIDSETNTLYKQNPPNNGGLEKIGVLGLDVDAANGFDIGGTTGSAYALLTVSGSTGLYSINLTTGAATKISDFAGSAKGFALGFGL